MQSPHLSSFQLQSDCTKLWFEFQKVHYTFDDDTRRFRTVEMDTALPFRVFQDCKGLETEESVVDARQQFGDNQ